MAIISLDALQQQAPQQSNVISLDDLEKRQPADANLQQEANNSFAAEHPYQKTLQDTYNQGIVNPFVQMMNAVGPAVRGIEKNIGMPDKGGKQLSSPDMSNAPMAAKVLGDVAGGGTQAAMAVPLGLGNPFLGFANLKGLEASGNNQPVLPAMAQGAVSAIPYWLGGKVGSTAANALAQKAGQMPIFNPIAQQMMKYAPNLGTAAGMGAAGAATNPEEPVRGAATGAIFGALSPSTPAWQPKEVTQAQYDDILSKHADAYRQMLNPGKGIIKRIEIKGKGDIDESMNLAAKLGLPLEKDQTGKLDTSMARQEVQQAVQPLHEQLNSILQSNQEPQFDLNEIRNQSLESLKNNPKFKNAQEYDKGEKDINNLIDAEIKRNGENPNVNGAQLNNIKEGMWSVGYDNSAPNNFFASRQLGNNMKTAIEDAYNNADVKSLNRERGKYLQLDNILADTHGQVVQGGKIGKYVAEITGMGAGALAGHATGIPFAEAALGMAGKEIGARAQNYANDPARITSALSNKIKGLTIKPDETINPINPFNPKDVTPEVKQHAKDITNQAWQKGIIDPLNPVNHEDIAKKVLGIGAATVGAGMFTNQAQAKEIPANEQKVIQDVASQYKLNPEQTKLLSAIRLAENGGPGKEFGVLNKEAMRFKNNPEQSLKTQAEWAAGTIKKHYNGDLEAFQKRWAPVGAGNDPKGLNKNWLKNVRKFMAQ